MPVDIKTIIELYGKFPRQFSKKREMVNNIQDLEKSVDLLNNIDDVYTSVYCLNFIIDKIWWELDAPSIEKARVEAKRQIDKLNELGIPHMVIFSGNKGFHFYVLTNDWKPSNKSTGDVVLKDIVGFLTDGIQFIDRYSQSSQMVRMVNTIHPKTELYCSYVEDIHQFHIDDYYEQHQIPETSKIDILKLYEKCNFGSGIKPPQIQKKTLPGHTIVPKNTEQFLKPLLRPCIYEIMIYDRNPVYEVRGEFVKEMMWLGYSIDNVLSICISLQWKDYNENKCRYQIRKIFEKQLMPMKCDHLKTFVRCTDCGFRYFWHESME